MAITRTLLLGWIVVPSCALAMAQVQLGTGAISGAVTDPSGQVIPEAAVTIINGYTGLTRTVNTTGAAAFAKVHVIKDGKYVYTTEPNARKVDFVWKDAAAERGKTSYYYVRGEQADGELVWVSPMWITYR